MKKVSLVVVGLMLTSFAMGAILETQGFETDTSGWSSWPSGSASTITRVGSGDNSITSSSGDYHAVIFMDGVSEATETANGGAYTYPGGGINLLPGFEKAIYSVDVYLNPADYSIGDEWDMQVSMSINGDGVTTQDGYKTFSFVCRTDENNVLSIGRNSVRAGIDPERITVTEAGWYTLSTEWTETVNGLVDYNYIYHDGVKYDAGLGVNSLNLTGSSYDTGYQWIFGSDYRDHTLAIDNASFEVTGIPEPATLALLSLGGLLLRKRK